MIRYEVQQLVALGQFPASSECVLSVIEQQENWLQRINAPLSMEEARAMITLFGPDDYFGLAWTVLHLIEMTDGWPMNEILIGDNEWIERLRRGIPDQQC